MKIMQSEIDKMIQEEYEDYEFLNEVRKPEKEASMRIAKSRVKEIIQEELDRFNAAESQDVDEGFISGIRFRAAPKEKESPLPGEGGAHDVDAFKGRVKDAIRRTYARPEEGAPADWESAIAESILKEINATYEASWKPTHVRGEELPNLGINLMEFFVATQRVVSGFFGRDRAEEIMAKLEPSMEALEADSKERQTALKADLDTAENF